MTRIEFERPMEHLDAEVIARLAEGQPRENLGAGVIEHLARCPECALSYSEAVRFRAAWLNSPGALPVETPGGSSASTRFRSDAARSRRIVWLAAACLALAMAIGTTVRWRSDVERRGSEPIVAMLERASSTGLVLPGGEAGAVVDATPYRSGDTPDPAAERAIERLRQAHERSPLRGRDFSLLIAGLLASGRVDLAYDYLQEARRQAPADTRLIALAGIAAHLSGDREEAKRLLGEAVRLGARDATTRLDLALVIAEEDGLEAAAPHLDEVIRRAPHTALAERAQRVRTGYRTP